MSNSTQPVSIIIPAYCSDKTIGKCLQTMQAQTYPQFEIVVIDSSPDESTKRIVMDTFPDVRYEHGLRRLLPHAARNRGVELAHNDLLLFTDPDIYAPPDWLAKMAAAYRKYGGVIIGSIACYERGWMERGTHLCKFDELLPGGEDRRIVVGPTANMLCGRKAFVAVGGFEGEFMLADTLMGWAFAKAGIPVWFVPTAVVEHHHLSTWGGVAHERYQRGREFAELRVAREGWPTWRVLRHAILSLVVPLRLLKLTWRGMSNAWRAGALAEYIWVSPVVVSGQAAWLAGETAYYLRWLAGNREGE